MVFKKKITFGVIVLLLLIMAFFSFYSVPWGQSIVVYRFGRIVSIENKAGLKFKFPFETIERYQPRAVKRMEIGFRSDLSKKKFTDRNAKPQLWELKHVSIKKETSESLVITEDENIVDINCVVHFFISNLRDYLVRVSRPASLVKNVVESSLRKLIGKEKLEDILVENKFQLQEAIKKEIQAQLDIHQVGVLIEKINLQDIHPPVEVVHSFRDVTSAREDKNTEIYKAMQYREGSIPQTRGEAHRMVLSAEADREQKILRSQGDLSRFLPLNRLYRTNRSQILTKKYYDYVKNSYGTAHLYIVSESLFAEMEIFKEQVKSESLDDFADEVSTNKGM